MTLFNLFTPQYTYCDYLKVRAKIVSKHAQQNQETDIELLTITTSSEVLNCFRGLKMF